jgi:hypothetical protein
MDSWLRLSKHGRARFGGAAQQIRHLCSWYGRGDAARAAQRRDERDEHDQRRCEPGVRHDDDQPAYYRPSRGHIARTKRDHPGRPDNPVGEPTGVRTVNSHAMALLARGACASGSAYLRPAAAQGVGPGRGSLGGQSPGRAFNGTVCPAPEFLVQGN